MICMKRHISLLSTTISVVILAFILSTCAKSKRTDRTSGVPLPPPTQNGGQLVFKTTNVIDLKTVSAYIVGLKETHTAALSKELIFFIPDVPEGIHDVIILTTEKSANQSVTRGLRVDHIEFTKGKFADIGNIELLNLVELRGSVKRAQDADMSNIEVYIPGTEWRVTSDSDGVYSFPEVPVGIHPLYFDAAGYNRGRIESIKLRADETSVAPEISLVPESLVKDTFLLLALGETKYDSRIVPVHLGASDEFIEMIISVSSNFSNTSWEPFRTLRYCEFSTPGAKTLYVKFRDLEENESDVLEASIEVSLFPESSVNLSINNGAIEAASKSMAVTFDLPDNAQKMGYSTRDDFGGAKWVDAANGFSYDLLDYEGGVITIYLKFMDANGFESPVYTDSIIYPLVQVDSGNNFTCALAKGGIVSCWGSNSSTQLGTGIDSSENSSSKPVRIRSLTGAKAIATGTNHACAINSSGGVVCWGAGTSGQLGNDEVSNYSSPDDVYNLASGISSISAGEIHTCAINSSGAISCWGSNNNGQIGVDESCGTSGIALSRPRSVSGLSATSISAGLYHTCAVRETDGALRCWGDNAYGQMGNNQSGTDVCTPTATSDNLANVKKVTAGGYHTCALLNTGALYCWGRNEQGQVGVNSGTLKFTTPQAITSLGTSVTDIAAGKMHTCALTSDKKVYCWGQTPGVGASTEISPTEITSLSGIGTAVTAGDSFTCLQTTTWTGIKCWGTNASGQLGDGTSSDNTTPQDVISLSKSL